MKDGRRDGGSSEGSRKEVHSGLHDMDGRRLGMYPKDDQLQ